ncbi:MAG: acyltransferase [Bacteroidetes bacterium]|nr:acyltransferase [Bacteroidota bacterium]
MRPLPYLKGLDILRFLAASLVVLAHTHYHLTQLQIPWYDHSPLLRLGQPAVVFFFTLSGVLLTCLGIQEQARTGDIDVRSFYYRRILRIWPLYYAVVALILLFVFVLLPVFYPSAENRFPMPVSLFCLLFLVPNYLNATGIVSFGAANALWSIGVEEAFYLFFPLLLKGHRKWKSYVLIFSVALIIHLIIYTLLIYSTILPTAIKQFLSSYSFQYMLVGCLFAAIWMKCRENRPALQRFNIVLALLGIISFLLLKYPVGIPVITSVVKSVFFAVIILFTAQVDNRFFRNNPLVYFGKISYGIYVFHPFVSYGLRFCCGRFPGLLQLIQKMPALYFIFLLSGAILFAHLSYRYYEQRFLRLKRREATP